MSSSPDYRSSCSYSSDADVAIRASAEPRWHWYHKHGDFVIKATDGMLFKADQRRLAEASDFFADMFETATPEYERDITPTVPQSSSDTLSDTRDGRIEESDAQVAPDDLKKPSMKALDIGMDTRDLDLFLNVINVSFPFHALVFHTYLAPTLQAV
ncbi:hypothetical protein IAU59_000859 [Kwoniella sp. CBS 9459]